MFDLEDDTGKMHRSAQSKGDEPMLSQATDNSPSLSRRALVTTFAEQALDVMQREYPSNTRTDHLWSMLHIYSMKLDIRSAAKTEHYRPIIFFGVRLECSTFELAHGTTLLLLAEESISSEQRTQLERSLATTFSRSYPDPRSADRE